MKTKSISDEFYRLSSLIVSFAGSVNNRIAHIYGNGLNQVEVYITARIVNAQGDAIAITPEELQPMIFLCDHLTGNPVSSPWSVSDERGEYVNAIRYTAARENDDPVLKDNGFVTISKFISASRFSSGAVFAAGITIPGVGSFNTTVNGTATLNGPGGASGSVFRNPDYVTVIAEEPVSYNNGRHIKVTHTDRIFIKYLRYTARYSAAGPFYNHPEGGRLERKVVSFASEFGYGFQKYEMNVKKLTNSDIATGKIIDWGKDSIKETGFNFLRSGNTYVPFAAYGRYNPEDNRYHTYVWFPRKTRVSFDGSTYSSRPEWNSRLQVDMSEVNHTNDNEGGAVTILLYDAVTGANNKNPLQWEYKGLSGNQLTVYDIFGNSGTFSLTFDPDKYYDAPALG